MNKWLSLLLVATVAVSFYVESGKAESPPEVPAPEPTEPTEPTEATEANEATEATAVTEPTELTEAPEPPSCEIKGQKYYECVPCQRTCEEQNPSCPKICKPGCGCSAKKVLKTNPNNNKQRCVKPKRCP